MTFSIDTGKKYQEVRRISTGIDRDARLNFIGRAEHAERFHRQIIGNIQCMEDIDDLDIYVRDESMIIDALFLSLPEYAAAIQTAHEDHRILLQGAADYERRREAKSDPAEPGTQPAHTPNIGNSAKDGDDYDFFD